MGIMFYCVAYVVIYFIFASLVTAKIYSDYINKRGDFEVGGSREQLTPESVIIIGWSISTVWPIALIVTILYLWVNVIKKWVYAHTARKRERNEMG